MQSTVRASGKTRRKGGAFWSAGYTLIEMLIAMVLVAALMSSMWGILSLYNHLLTSGKERTGQQQLVRSIFQVLDEDLLGVVLPTAEQTPSTGSTSPSLLDTADTNSVFSDPLSAVPMSSESAASNSGQQEIGRLALSRPGQMSLVGTSTAMRLAVRRFVEPSQQPVSDIDLLNQLGGGSAGEASALPDGIAARVPEFQMIVYQFESAATASGPTALPPGLLRLTIDASEFSAMLDQQSTAERSRGSDEVALSRTTLEALLFPAADDRTAAEADAADVEGVAHLSVPQIDYIPEITGCRFQYFDGQSWLSAWSADRGSKLPAAIRVTLDVVSAQDLQRLTPGVSSQTTSDEFQKQLLSGQQPSATNAAPAAQVQSSLAAQTVDVTQELIPATRFERLILLETARVPAGAEPTSFAESGL